MKTLAIRLATGIAGSAALIGAVASPALAYYGGYNTYYPYGYNNSSAYCSDRYSPNCMMQSWGPGYYQTYNTNYGTWYQTSAPYNSYSYSYPYYQPTYSYNTNYPYNYSYSYPNYSYQYQYQYQYQYSW